jgi:hypothetical protein
MEKEIGRLVFYEDKLFTIGDIDPGDGMLCLRDPQGEFDGDIWVPPAAVALPGWEWAEIAEKDGPIAITPEEEAELHKVADLVDGDDSDEQHFRYMDSEDAVVHYQKNGKEYNRCRTCARERRTSTYSTGGGV